MYVTLSFAALSASLLASVPGNAPVVPLSIEYFNSAGDSSEANLCEMIVTLTNPAPPEHVTLSAFAGYDKVEGAIAVGLVVGASKQLPGGDLEIVDVTSAAIISDDFNSADEFDHEVSGEGDGLFMAATVDAGIANRLLEAVAAGGFYLTVSGNEPDISSWTYKVKGGAPADVSGRFARCLDELDPGIVSLRSAHTPLPRTH